MISSLGGSGRESPRLSHTHIQTPTQAQTPTPTQIQTQTQTKVPSLASSRASPFVPHDQVKHAMDNQAFVPQAQAQPYRQTNGSHPVYPLAMSTGNGFEREVANSGASNGLSGACAIVIRRLPLKTTEDSLRSMVVWSKEFLEAEVLSQEKSEDPGFRAAVLHFKTPAGAQEAQRMLNGKPNIANDAQMIVDLFHGSPSVSRRYPVEGVAYNNNAGPASSTSSTGSSTGPLPRQSSRFNGTFQNMERISPTNNGTYASNELPNPESGTHYTSLFSPQSPIGNHLSERTRISGKTLINNDSVDDDETGELLKDPVAYAENGHSSAQARRATNPPLPISRLAGLSLKTNQAAGPPSLSNFGTSATMTSAQAPPMSPTLVPNGAPPPLNYPLGNQHYQRHSFPTANPADQNPPCNTLYVGNLPIDTSEDELKATFSKQRGYKRLCFRTKQNGPMCFVEFEDVTFATKALHELYGHLLHNSIKGGIRLSFSKNPLGVRSGQGPGTPGPAAPSGAIQGMSGMAAGLPGASFSTANGPPPGLSAPPGLGPSRVQYGAVMNPMNGSSGPYGSASFIGNGNGNGNGWTGQIYNTSVGALSQTATMNGTGNSFPPAYMMGR